VDYAQADALNSAIRLIAIKHRSQAGVALAALGLYPGQESLLLELDARGECTQVQLAASLVCEPPSVTLMAQKLEAAGLISRRPSSHDSRANIVALTDQGRDLIPRLKEVWQRLAETTVAGLERTSLDQLLAVLDDLARSLSSGAPRQ